MYLLTDLLNSIILNKNMRYFIMKGKNNENVYFFLKDDKGYLDFIIKNGGYVYNDFSGSNVSYKKLHKFDCSWLHNLGRGKFRTSVPKIFSPRKEDIIEWLNKNRGHLGIGYSECPCMNNINYKTADIDLILSSLEKHDGTKYIIKDNNDFNPKICNKEIDADIVKKFARKLTDIYNNKKIPLYLEYFKKAGFAKDSLISDKNKIFQLIILASYDQQPFTRAAGGWEPIWFKLPEVLKKLGLFTLENIRENSIPEIQNKLKGTTFYNYHLSSKGTTGSSYTETFKDTLRVCEDFKCLKLYGGQKYPGTHIASNKKYWLNDCF